MKILNHYIITLLFIILTFQNLYSRDFKIYKVKRGDNLTKISKKFGISTTSISKYNKLRNFNKLYVGKKLKIPTYQKKNITKRYKVKYGDTLYSIARKHKISVSSLKRTNNIRNVNSICKGKILKISYSEKNNNKRTNRNKKLHYRKKNSHISKPNFNWPIKYVKKFRRDGKDGVKAIGIIITGKTGSPILSSESGVVKKIGHMRGFGKYIIVKHNNRYISVYSKLTKINVTTGEKLRRGKCIGFLGKKNNQIHFQIGHAGKNKNPLKFLPSI